MKKNTYFHFLVFLVLLFGSTVTTSAQKLVDISHLFGDGVPPNSIFVDTTGYELLDSMPTEIVPHRTYSNFFVASVSTAENPCKHISSDSSCRTGTTMNTSTEKLRAAHDSASRYYPGSLWCVPELSMNSDDHTIYIELEEIELQERFASRFKIWSGFNAWIIPVPVSVDESQPRSSRDRYAVYPNPVSTSMTIAGRANDHGVAKRLSIDILDALGQRVVATEIVDGESLDVSALGNGAYKVIISEVDRNTADASVVQIIVNK